MRFEQLRRRVEIAERRVGTHLLRSETGWSELKLRWRESWTPGRILAVGLAGGFLFARTRPMRAVAAVSTARWIQMATSLSGLFASLKAAQSAESAEVAAAGAEGAATEAADVAGAAAQADGGLQGQVPATGPVAVAAGGARADIPVAGPAEAAAYVGDRRRRPDPQWDTEPRPAEAATDVSER